MGNSESLQLRDNPRYSIGPATYNPRLSRRLEEEYVDISSELDVVSKEEMEDQFIKIVVGSTPVASCSNCRTYL